MDAWVIRGHVWPGWDAEPFEGAVVVRGDRILEVGLSPAVPTGAREVEVPEGLILPGFVQSHVHCAQTLFRGLAEDLPLLPWLRTRIWPFEAAHTPESLGISAELTAAELLRGGTVAVQSFETVRHTDAVFQALDRAGLIAVVGHCLMDETSGHPPLSVPWEQAREEMDGLREAWDGHPRLRVGVAPRFALSCSAETLEQAAAYARRHGLRLHTHASEQTAEIEEVRSRTGRANLEFLHAVGLTGSDCGLAHCVHLSESERDLLATTGTHVLHCPSANFKLGSGIAPVPGYLARGVPVSLGADGAPCNNRLDMFAEMRLAGLMQSMAHGPGALSAREIVRMATEGGAAALGMAEELGRLEAGRRACLAVLDLRGPHLQPPADPATRVVYQATAADVVLTMVDGRILCQRGCVQGLDDGVQSLDEAELRVRVAEAARNLVRRAEEIA